MTPDDLVQALVNSWMTRNSIFTNSTNAEDKSGDTIKKTSWDKRWDFLNIYFHRLMDAEWEDQKDDTVTKVLYRWSSMLYKMLCEKPRRYHTPLHLEEMFGYMDLFLDNIPAIAQAENEDISTTTNYVDAIRATMTLSTLFHDAVYDPKSGTNEEDSAALYRTFASELEDTTSSRVLDHDRVEQYILATRHLNNSSVWSTNDIFLKLFIDADMAVLGKCNSAYDVYSGLIREEYKHVPREVYCEKRSQVLSSFLCETSIFHSKVMKDALEGQSRTNLKREIELLSQGIIPGEIM